MSTSLQQSTIEAIREIILAALPDVWAIYLHGSVASGNTRPDSDVDIALLLPPAQHIPDLLGLSAALADVTGREVDIADLRRAGNMLRKEVLTHGLTLYAANPERVLAWEAGAMTEYAEHRMRIRDLLEDFQHTGIGYRA
jgi:predicted nucleotidyltransferase